MVNCVSLLFFSNIFMTFAWYGHLKNYKSSALWMAILVSWGIAFFEYCLQVPANRLGSNYFTLPQLKIIQEVITMMVFAGFTLLYMKQPLKLDFLWASLCMVGAVYFMFRGA
ncbi:MAG: DMT family protein [Pseudobdellovibrionaceae bacterium]